MLRNEVRKFSNGLDMAIITYGNKFADVCINGRFIRCVRNSAIPTAAAAITLLQAETKMKYRLV